MSSMMHGCCVDAREDMLLTCYRLIFCNLPRPKRKKKTFTAEIKPGHWSHIDYTSDVFTIFLELESGNYIALNGGPDISQMNKSLGVINDGIVIFG